MIKKVFLSVRLVSLVIDDSARDYDTIGLGGGAGLVIGAGQFCRHRCVSQPNLGQHNALIGDLRRIHNCW